MTPQLQEGTLARIEAVVIGASAGAVGALSVLLPPLTRDFLLPILVVVHQPPNRPSSIAALFQSKCALRVKEAEDKEPIAGGTIYFAPPDYHLLVEKTGVLSLSSEEEENFSRPSIDALFETAADAFGPALLAMVLTGANEDGARGIAAVCEAGGIACVQRPDTAEARMMPQSALAACAGAIPMSLPDLAGVLQSLTGKPSNAN